METAVYLDLIALIPPAVGLSLLFRRRAALHEVKTSTVAAASLYFMSAVTFDLLANLGIGTATIGIWPSLFLLFSTVGFLAASLCYCPESHSVKESVSKTIRTFSFPAYEAALAASLATTALFQGLYLPVSLSLWAVTTWYPTALFLIARRRARTTSVKDMLTILSTTWLGLGLVTLPMTLLATSPVVSGLSLSRGWQVNFVAGSLFYYFTALAVTDPTGLTRLWMNRLVPHTIIELGRRYLIVHDTGNRTCSFLSNTTRSMIESGSKVVVRLTNHPGDSWLFETLTRSDPRFSEWVRNGRLVRLAEGDTSNTAIRVSPGASSTVFIKNLESDDLLNGEPSVEDSTRTKGQMSSEILLLESSKAPRAQLNEFLKRNHDIQVVDLSEPKDYFSAMVNIKHDLLHGAKVLLEYDSTSDLGVVEKFFMEGIAYGEKCVLFTSKSSSLYRAIKGKELVKIVAASSIVSVPEELPDGEVQIPDRELGLVTSIASGLLEDSNSTAVRFVFDSVTELIRGDRWEQLYSGVKQLFELLSLPQATAIFLANKDTLDPKLIGALRAVFSVQMKLDGMGLQIMKLSSA